MLLHNSPRTELLNYHVFIKKMLNRVQLCCLHLIFMSLYIYKKFKCAVVSPLKNIKKTLTFQQTLPIHCSSSHSGTH